MLSKLTAGMNEAEKEEISSSYRLAHAYRERTKKLLTKDYKETLEKIVELDPSDTPDYALTVAKLGAEARAIKKMLKFF